MIKKIIEKLYLNQENNLVYYDKYMDTKTEVYYNKVGLNKYKEFVGKIFFIDTSLDGLMLPDDGVRDVLRHFLYKKNIVDVFRIRGDKFIVLTKPEFMDEHINTIEDIAYGFIEKKKNDDLNDCVKKAVRFAMLRKNKIITKRQKQFKQNKKR